MRCFDCDYLGRVWRMLENARVCRALGDYAHRWVPIKITSQKFEA
jgi:hypothetical protein